MSHSIHPRRSARRVVAGKRVTFGGVLLEKSGEGSGLLLSPDAEMAVTLAPGP